MEHVESFARAWTAGRGRPKIKALARKKIVDFARNTVRQMLRQAIPGYAGRGRPHRLDNPFASQASHFFEYLKEEKGLRPASMTVLPASRSLATALWRARSLAACSAMRRPPPSMYLRNNSTRRAKAITGNRAAPLRAGRPDLPRSQLRHSILNP